MASKSRRGFAAVAAIVSVAGYASLADAQSCPIGTAGCTTTSSGGTSGGTSIDATPLAAATHAAIRDQSDTIDMALSDQLRWRLRAMGQAQAPARAGDADDGFVRGMSAGSPAQSFSAWADASASYLKNDTVAFANEGYGVTALSGLDYAHSDSWLFGFTAGYARTQLKVKALSGEKVEQGALLGPYLSYIVNEHVAVDSSFTYGRLDNSFTGSSSFDADRFTGAANLDLFGDRGGFKLSAVIGYLYAYESPATASAPTVVAGFPTTQRYGAVKVSTEVAYPIGKFEPYLPLAYSYETTHPVDAVGRDTVTLGIGVRYDVADSLRVGLQATDDELRTHSRDDVIAANLRFSF